MKNYSQINIFMLILVSRESTFFYDLALDERLLQSFLADGASLK